MNAILITTLNTHTSWEQQLAEAGEDRLRSACHKENLESVPSQKYKQANKNLALGIQEEKKKV